MSEEPNTCTATPGVKQRTVIRDRDSMLEHMIRNRVAIVVHPQRVVSWDHSKLSFAGRSRAR